MVCIQFLVMTSTFKLGRIPSPVIKLFSDDLKIVGFAFFALKTIKLPVKSLLFICDIIQPMISYMISLRSYLGRFNKKVGYFLKNKRPQEQSKQFVNGTLIVSMRFGATVELGEFLLLHCKPFCNEFLYLQISLLSYFFISLLCQ